LNQHEKALTDFIRNNPRAAKTQFMIDKRLDLCKSQSERLVVIFKMMGESFYKLRLALNGDSVIESEVIEFKPNEDER